MSDSGRTYRAAEMVQTNATIAAIVLALATIAEEQGPDIRGLHLIPLTLLFAGFFAVVGSLYAIEELREEATGRRSEWSGVNILRMGYEVIFFSMWSIRMAGATYLWLLVDKAP